MNSAELMQLVWFTASQSHPLASDTYTALVGEAPDGSQRNRNVNSADPILSTANGIIRNNVAELQVRPGRVDLLLRNENVSPNSEDPPTLDLQKAIISLQKVISRAPEALGPVVRVSMVSRLTERATNSSDATAKILSVVGLDLDAPDLTDGLFSINSRLTISDRIKVNRIMRFEVIGLQTYAFGMQAAAQALFPVIKEQSYFLMQLDINTVPLSSAMTVDEHQRAFSAIIEQTSQLAKTASPKGLSQ